MTEVLLLELLHAQPVNGYCYCTDYKMMTNIAEANRCHLPFRIKDSSRSNVYENLVCL